MDYKVVNGTSYNVNTPDKVIEILEKAKDDETRIRLFYGDSKTGLDWMEIFDTIGYIGRSTGINKVPLLKLKSNSYAGGAIITSSIVKITIDKKTVYKHPKYHLPKIKVIEDGKLFNIYKDETIVSVLPSKEKAENEILFYKGLRNKIA